MSEPNPAVDRDHQVRRTTSARRGVVAAGAVGAVGAAVAIGVSIQSAEAGTSGDDRGATQVAPQEGTTQQDDRSLGTQASPDRLAGPSGGGPAQGRSSGS